MYRQIKIVVVRCQYEWRALQRHRARDGERVPDEVKARLDARLRPHLPAPGDEGREEAVLVPRHLVLEVPNRMGMMPTATLYCHWRITLLLHCYIRCHCRTTVTTATTAYHCYECCHQVLRLLLPGTGSIAIGTLQIGARG